ncbi:hypothetical protein [Arthrobacter sp. NPDC080082]|uniref:hypothetical protein n=1 Tax=unclassified Arthrobacter TaxID=235627 RepID=UPI0034377B59
MTDITQSSEFVPDDSPGDGGRISAKSAARVGAASITAAAAGIVILFLTSHALSPADNAEFLSFWAALFFVCGVLGGVQAETTRAVGAARLKTDSATAKGARVFTSGLIVGLAAAVVIAALSPLLTTFVFHQDAALVVAALVLTAVLFSCHATLAGAAQGSDQWTLFAGLVSLEALLRLGAIALAAVAATSLVGIEMACLAALAAWLLVLLVSPGARSALAAKGDVALPRLLQNTGHALLSAASSAALIVAFPILLKLTTSPADYALSAPILLAISLTRAPIMVPLQAFQGVALSEVVKNPHNGWRTLRKPLGILLAMGVVGAIAAWLVGPRLMLIFGPSYAVAGWALAALTLAAVLMAVLTLLGTIVIGLGQHRAYSAGWLTATVVAVVILLLPAGVEVRSIFSLSLGPIAGILVHSLAIARMIRARRTESAS